MKFLAELNYTLEAQLNYIHKKLSDSLTILVAYHLLSNLAEDAILSSEWAFSLQTYP